LRNRSTKKQADIDKWTNGQMDKQTVELEKHLEREVDKQSVRHVKNEKWTKRQIAQMDKQTVEQTDIEKDKWPKRDMGSISPTFF